MGIGFLEEIGKAVGGAFGGKAGDGEKGAPTTSMGKPEQIIAFKGITTDIVIYGIAGALMFLIVRSIVKNV